MRASNRCAPIPPSTSCTSPRRIEHHAAHVAAAAARRQARARREADGDHARGGAGDDRRRGARRRAPGRRATATASTGRSCARARSSRAAPSARVRMITAQYYTDFLYRLRRPEELDTAQGGGVVLNQGAHQVDIVRLLAGGEATSVRALTGRWDPARPTEGAYAALVTFADGAFASLVYGGYAHFDGDELCGGATELGGRQDPARYGAARRRIAGLADAGEEAAAKAARNYGGGAQVPSAAERSRAPALRLRARLVRARRSAPAARRRDDLRRCARRRLDPLPPPRVPRVEVIDELYAAVVARPSRRCTTGAGAWRRSRSASRCWRRRARAATSRSTSRSRRRRVDDGDAHRRRSRAQERLAHLVKDVGRTFDRALQMRLAEHEVSIGHWPFLRVLWAADGLTQRELSEEAGVMEPTTFAALKAMERRGYIVRRPVAGDRRKRQVFLTARGRALEAKLVPLAKDVNAIAARGVPAADVAATRRTLLALSPTSPPTKRTAAAGAGCRRRGSWAGSSSGLAASAPRAPEIDARPGPGQTRMTPPRSRRANWCPHGHRLSEARSEIPRDRVRGRARGRGRDAGRDRPRRRAGGARLRAEARPVGRATSSCRPPRSSAARATSPTPRSATSSSPRRRCAASRSRSGNPSASSRRRSIPGSSPASA